MPSDQPQPSHFQRWRTLREMERWLETPMDVLALLWLVLAVVELARGLSPALQTLTTVLWALFVIDFAIRLLLAPAKLVYLRRNWLTALSLIVPALRVLRFLRGIRVLRAARALRSVRLVRVVGTMNRSMRTLERQMRRRRLGYVSALTAAVVLLGAAGMLAFERSPGNGAPGLTGYGDALWWTAMVLTTLGSAYWPQTLEGRVLCVILSIYAIGVFGYITASLATFFLGKDASEQSDTAALVTSIGELRKEIQELRGELSDGDSGPPV